LRFFSAIQMILFVLLIIIFLISCKPEKDPGPEVEIIKENNSFELTRNGEPFYIKVAVAWNKCDMIKQYGGNAVRTTFRGNRLELADSLGLACMVNLPVRAERDGMD
jgi:hypothetical protein